MHPEKVIAIKKIGNIRTIDIEVNNNSHTFYANGGIVTSNSHAATYGKDSYWTAFMKAHFPMQFFCSYIQGARWKQETQHEIYELVNDAKLFDINVSIPDIRHTEYDAHIKNDVIYFGISGIKNI